MKSELEQRLQTLSKEQLIQLLQDIAGRHPVLLTEMVSILENLSGEELTEDWDFSGDEQAVLSSFPPHAPLLLDKETQRQRLEKYAARLSQEKSPQVFREVLSELIDEAIAHIEQNNYHSALDLFALLFDERLLERTPDLVPIFDEMIDTAIPSLETLLSEASSNTIFDADTAALAPFLTVEIRHGWLERLFALWLKRLDEHRIEEDLPGIMLDVAWNEDLLLLRSLAQNELQKQLYGEDYLTPRQSSNIVDFTRQYRTKALEKFLKELP